MEAKEYIYTKMFYNNKISYMKIIKHGELWAYDDFVVSVAIHLNISAFEIESLSDSQDIIIPKESFVEIVEQFYQQSNFFIKINIKKNSEIGTPVVKQNCIIGSSIYISSNELETYILESQSGFTLGKKLGTSIKLQGLSDMERRAIVRESVDLLVKKYSHHPEPIYIESLAQAMIELFPQLKSTHENEIELLYNRKQNRGYILSRLQRLRRKIYSVEDEDTTTRKRKSKYSIVLEESTTNSCISFEDSEDFIILKNANVVTQKELIKSKLQSTLKLRIQTLQYNKDIKYSISFPFYFTAPDLISFDFELCYPDAQNFMSKWTTVHPHVFKVYLDLKGETYRKIPEIEEWTESLKPILYLLNLLPQNIGGVSSSKKSRAGFSTINLTIDELKEFNAIHL